MTNQFIKPKPDMTSPPTISLAPFFSPSADKTQVVQEIRSAAIHFGFFNVVDHNVPHVLEVKFWEVMKYFFHDVPSEVKEEIYRDQNNVYGYFDTEFTKNKLDWKKGWDYSVGGLVDGSPRWPQGEEQFKEIVLEYYEEMRKLGEVIVGGIAMAFGKEQDYFEEMFQGHTSLFRLNYYPVFEGEDLDPDTLCVGPHSDVSAITILKQDDSITSLQVYLGDEDGLDRYDPGWIDVPPIPNAYSINVGDLAQVWSNGTFNAAKHRVLPNPKKERFSAPFFYFPNFDATIKPEIDDEPKYVPFNFGEFRMSRFAGDYADVGEEIQITRYEIK